MDIVSLAHWYSVVASVLVVVAGLPQAWMMWRKRSAENVSLAMWVMLAIALGGFLVRSIVIVRDPVFLVQQAASTAINLFVIGEILYFRKRGSLKKKGPA